MRSFFVSPGLDFTAVIPWRSDGWLSEQVPALAASARKLQPPPCVTELGSNLRTILRTNVGFQEKTAPSKSLRTIGMTIYAP